MLYTQILADDWRDYDAVKERHRENPQLIDFSKRWELNFITELLHKHYPKVPKGEIKLLLYNYATTKGHFNQRDKVIAALDKMLASFPAHLN